jgi:cysteinyl-tRNA synthetase
VSALEESKKTLDSWYDVIGDDTQAVGDTDEGVSAWLGDDLNTSGAITRLHTIASEARGPASGSSQIELKRKLKTSAMMLGLLFRNKGEYLANDPEVTLVDKAHVDGLIAARTAARARKDFKESDRIRDELAAMGIAIKDSKEGTTWEIAR